MAYQPLARKYRPAQFHELVGQEAVAKALANAIALGREAHAVVFTGVRGIGKTTVARIYAKALNCRHRQMDPTATMAVEPCGKCDSCQAVSDGVHEDVLEIDGASNNGVDHVRALQETVDYRPQRSAFRVFIIDEVHMLSPAAFNALLKTLEEPPAHVVFVLATTEVQRLPETILSRCQTFYLKKLTPTLILQRLQAILNLEGLAAEEKAVAAIAREGHGSMRDALTLLDQAVALGRGQVTVASLGPLVSNLSSSPYLDLLAAMLARDAARAMRAIESLDNSGAAFPAVAEATARMARHGFVLHGLGREALDTALLGLDAGEMATLTALATAAAPLDLNRIFRTLVKCRQDMDGSDLDRCVFENFVFEWCFDPGLPDISQLLAAGNNPALASPSPTGAKSLNAPVPPIPPVPTASAAPSAPKPQAAPGLKAPALPEAHSAPPTSTPRGTPGAANYVFPPTWRELVEAWKQQKPLQARKLEEALPRVYGPNLIELMVSDQSYASRCLLQRDEQTRIKEHFRDLFAFKGDLRVLPLASADAAAVAPHPPPPGATANPPPPAVPTAALPESILTQRQRESAERQKRLIDAATQAPFTRDVLAELGGRIEHVKIAGDSP